MEVKTHTNNETISKSPKDHLLVSTKSAFLLVQRQILKIKKQKRMKNRGMIKEEKAEGENKVYIN